MPIVSSANSAGPPVALQLVSSSAAWGCTAPRKAAAPTVEAAAVASADHVNSTWSSRAWPVA